MSNRFADKNVLVTGGTRGIGRAIVERFASEGANVAFTYRSSSSEADALVAELAAAGHTAKAFQADAADFSAAETAVNDVIAEWGSIDVIVNNAGVTRDNLMLRMSEEDFDAVVGTNLKSVFNYSKAAYRQMMRQRGGRIVNLSSVVGVMGNPGQTNYAASKAGIIGFSKSLAKELQYSTWSGQLTPEQEDDAALDAAVSLDSYWALQQLPDLVDGGNRE